MADSFVHSPLIKDMLSAAQNAARVALKYRYDEEFRKSCDVTIDLVVERMLSSELAEKYDYCFNGEEMSRQNLQTHKRWVVDGIDGTTNFLSGLENNAFPCDPNWAISLALKENDETIAAVVMDPSTGNIYWAELGVGAYVMNERNNIHHKLEFDKDLKGKIIMGTGGFTGNQPEAMHTSFCSTFLGIAKERGVRASTRDNGCLSLGIIYVATGAHHAFCSTAHEWDIAGAKFIAETVGAKVTEHEIIDDKKCIFVIAAHEAIHGKLLNEWERHQGVLETKDLLHDINQQRGRV